MSQKVRKTLIMIVMAALIICLMAASLTYTFTYGRYAGGKFDEESPYDDLIEFVGAREYTVRSPEELIQAIKDGYSNIVIAEDAEEPFVITEGVTDVEANLVLNLNGKVVVRNSRNPMLDVQTNVSVVLVYDSKQTGAFYNPVGSSLMASGGSLTVGSGGYESGPRAEEYENGTAAGTLGDTANATLFARSNETNNAVSGPTKLDRSKYVSDYSLVSGVSLPTITPKTTQENGRTSVRGNVYLSSNHSDWLPADTFLLYTIEKDCFVGDGTSSGGVTFESDKLYVDAESEKVDDVTTVTASEFTTPLCNVASCDFYYYYPIDKEGNPIDTAGTADSPQDYAVIYGYWDVMALARDDGGAAKALTGNGLIWPYAAVRMEEGEGFARGGQFSNHFDAVNTYGIYAEGGTLTASGANFTTGGNGVCIRVQSAEAEDKTTGGSLTISGGEFSSEIGNTIEMSGGNMTVTNGTFKKSGGKGIGEGNQENEQVANQTAMIDMQGGTLNINGSASNSVTMTAGGTNNGDTLTNVFGILAHSGGEVSVGGCTFNINGNYSAGVLSYDGTINLKDNTFINVTETHPEGQLTSAGVSSERDTSPTSSSTGSHPINMNGNVTITSNGLGITARGMINVKSGTTTVKTENATGIVVSGDANEPNGEQQAKLTVESDATLSVESTINSSLKWVNAPGHEGTGDTNVNNGIYVENGSIDASAGTLKVTHTGVAGDTPADSTTGAATKSYAVFVKGDAEGGSQNTTVSINAGTITGTNAGGVYVVGRKQGESYTATVTLGGVTVTARNTYAAGILTETGNVIINGNAHITSSALGIAVINGNVGIGLNNQNVSASVKATRATGVYVRGGTLYNWGTLSVESDLADENNNNLFYQHTGADISTPSTDPNPYNGVYVKGGSLNSTGTLNVTFTGVQNDNIEYDLSGTVFAGTGLTYDSQNRNEYYDPALNIIEEYTDIYQNFQTKSYAVRVEGTENTKVTIAEGNITNSVGGGVLVKGGKVYLGATVTLDDSGKVTNATPAKKPVSVSTTGNTAMEGRYITRAYRTGSGSFFDPYRYRVQLSSYIGISGAADNWAYRLSSTGGDAVKVDGGSLTVYGGEYHAAQGNGILVKTGTASVKGGTFDGGNGYNAVNTKDDFVAGAGVSYGFKLLGGSLTVENGLFESDSGGAFAMQGTVTFNGGKIDASGATGFSAWEGANVTFNSTSVEISVRGTSTGLAIETNTTTVPEVTINGGRFSGDQDGIWYGNGNAALTITGGNFTGNNRSGLYFDVVPSGNNVQLSGGTYYGKPEEHGVRHWYGNGAIGAEVGGTIYDLRNGNGYDIKLNNILGNESSIIESGSGKTYPRNNDALCDTVSSEEWVKIG